MITFSCILLYICGVLNRLGQHLSCVLVIVSTFYKMKSRILLNFRSKEVYNIDPVRYNPFHVHKRPKIYRKKKTHKRLKTEVTGM